MLSLGALAVAEQAYRLASGNGDAITVDLIYNDVTLNAIAVLYTNTLLTVALFLVTRVSNGVTGSFPVPPQSVAVRENLPGNISVTFNSRGYLLGVSFGMVF